MFQKFTIISLALCSALLNTLNICVAYQGYDISGPFLDDEMPSVMSLCNGTELTKNSICYKDSDKNAYLTSKATLRITNSGRAHCTGWLVGDEGHILTNWHCIETNSRMESYKFEAMAEGESCDTRCDIQLACGGGVKNDDPVTFVKSGGSIQKDYTLVKLSDKDTAKFEKFGFLKLRRSGPVVNERIYIPQHPAGWGKRIAMHNGYENAKVASVTHNTGCGNGQVAYVADTQGGSSGSPVIGYSDNAVIAIHHCGGCSSYGNTATHIDHLLEGLKGLLPKSAYLEVPSVTATPEPTMKAPIQCKWNWKLRNLGCHPSQHCVWNWKQLRCISA